MTPKFTHHVTLSAAGILRGGRLFQGLPVPDSEMPQPEAHVQRGWVAAGAAAV